MYPAECRGQFTLFVRGGSGPARLAVTNTSYLPIKLAVTLIYDSYTPRGHSFSEKNNPLASIADLFQ